MRQLLCYGLMGLLFACNQNKLPEEKLAQMQAHLLTAGGKIVQQQLADRWWSEYQKLGIPVVHDSTALFLYKGSAQTVQLTGDMTNWQPGGKFQRLGETDLHALQVHFPDSARFDYQLIVDGIGTLDPANPQQIMTELGPRSELRMPRYKPLSWLDGTSRAPRGQIEEFTIYSRTLANQRPIRIYLPPGYAQSQVVYPSLYVNDGLEYLDLAKLNLTLDYLIDAGEIRPVVVVCVSPLKARRNEEYGNNTQFVEFICRELVPRIQKRYRIIDNADHRGMIGASLGGFAAFNIALQNPEVFRLVAGQSSDFGYNNGSIFSLLPKVDLTLFSFYISCGTDEINVANTGNSFIDMHYRMRDQLRMGRARFGYREIAAGHSWGSWRDDLPYLLKYLLPAERIAQR
ncbi:MAG: alpha/beta hydrolase-fold protein [bacterium]